MEYTVFEGFRELYSVLGHSHTKKKKKREKRKSSPIQEKVWKTGANTVSYFWNADIAGGTYSTNVEVWRA